MSDVKDQLSIEDLTTVTGEVPVEGHDAWVREIIEKRLDQKRSGHIVYHDLDKIAEEFGFDAR
ncbi:hypothetical protein [Rhizobium sp. L1K21]|uniref:hypothetical protein n=1 Tax=Rhizobium sp. L1K21 TaxID=2954933 RepID=UPI002091F08D|nr:hypothetical protein [Rhizobium sp. L1K21]MCO6185010.1 hypothetical protein [Rhizobium sp. L1K21]